ILNGLGCHVLAYDVHPQPAVVAAGATYVDLETVLFESDIVTLHCPLLPDTHHLISAKRIERMRPGVMIINTSRGGLVDARAVIDGLKSRKIGALGLDVYEEEADLFFEDRSNDLLQDDVFARLTTFPNVLVTGHQAFFTKEALQQIAKTTVESLAAFEANLPLTFQVQKLND
ncbi:MAG: 2-hydroxyacid dehydrogenase, partial [Anaerolineales bacterium]|nr:2-hydroxyacid dehydrogenase [Anaerolineales bacterium]